jgi:hypothetical protein
MDTVSKIVHASLGLPYDGRVIEISPQLIDFTFQNRELNGLPILVDPQKPSSCESLSLLRLLTRRSGQMRTPRVPWGREWEKNKIFMQSTGFSRDPQGADSDGSGSHSKREEESTMALGARDHTAAQEFRLKQRTDRPRKDHGSFS